MKKTKKIDDGYSIELKVNDSEYTSTGKTLEEALNNIKVDPTRGVLKFYTKGIIKVKKGDKEIEKLLVIKQMVRLFGEASKMSKEVTMAQAIKLLSV